ncbi:MerR family transcriptional regulator [Mycolicibacterium canariasense]|uniref:MerR family transcriptional regulator n=1 Tax=Mycolicibacterium canariasense TaxID=228230 RepID=A0A100W939_MYCCR|nr:MerR family transcriptional regulator [Mycolicibacterium canariasense]MCV7212832.1 MerR family transcriptional regulator [Mycolicibacterium canariasense]ORV12555.1 MerR family transcriptional regulator [Mycolicibacterium canariasense]GAS93804.1 MerR family transcriptional regulator [Mycolicibacterium canariasense]
MAWSTREVAELAGTSLRAVRHYHQVGLLAEPERLANGYKQYGVAHLVRLVRIKRLVDLGFSLPQIADMGDTDVHPEEALRALDTELAATIDRLQRARVELGLLLERSAPTDLPPDLVPPEAVVRLSDADRSLVVVLTRVLGPRGIRAYSELLRNAPVEPAVAEFDNLPDDADERTRQDVAERLVPYMQATYAAHPEVLQARADAPGGERFAADTIAEAMSDLYNTAQLDVFRRARRLLAASDVAESST